MLCKYKVTETRTYTKEHEVMAVSEDDALQAVYDDLPNSRQISSEPDLQVEIDHKFTIDNLMEWAGNVDQLTIAEILINVINKEHSVELLIDDIRATIDE